MKRSRAQNALHRFDEMRNNKTNPLTPYVLTMLIAENVLLSPTANRIDPGDEFYIKECDPFVATTDFVTRGNFSSRSNYTNNYINYII